MSCNVSVGRPCITCIQMDSIAALDPVGSPGSGYKIMMLIEMNLNTDAKKSIP